MDKASINATIFLPHTVCQAAARGGCSVRRGELGAEGDARLVGQCPPCPTAPQPEQQNRSGDSDHIQPRVRITRPVCSDETGWVWGQAQDQWGSWPGTGMLSMQLQQGAGQQLGLKHSSQAKMMRFPLRCLTALSHPALLAAIWPKVTADLALSAGSHIAGEKCLLSLCRALIPWSRNKLARTVIC